MSWTDRWKPLGNIGDRGNLFVVEALDGSGRKAVVREPKFAPNGDDNDENRGTAGIKNEVAALKLLNAAGASVPKLYEAEINRGASFCVTEFIEGETLNARLTSSRPISDSEADAIADQLTRIFEIAHSLDIYHRDAHVYNFMLRPDGTVVAIDWTISAIGKAYQGEASYDREIIATVRNSSVNRRMSRREAERREAERRERFVPKE